LFDWVIEKFLAGAPNFRRQILHGSTTDRRRSPDFHECFDLAALLLDPSA